MRLGATALMVMAFTLSCAGTGAVENAGSGGLVVATMEVEVKASEARLLLHVTNTSDDALAFTFPTAQRYDFVVSTSGGEEVWRWSDGLAFTQAVSHDTLAPGETWDLMALWEYGDLEGEFVATGVVTAGNRALRKAAVFAIP